MHSRWEPTSRALLHKTTKALSRSKVSGFQLSVESNLAISLVLVLALLRFQIG